METWTKPAVCPSDRLILRTTPIKIVLPIEFLQAPGSLARSSPLCLASGCNPLGMLRNGHAILRSPCGSYLPIYRTCIERLAGWLAGPGKLKQIEQPSLQNTSSRLADDKARGARRPAQFALAHPHFTRLLKRYMWPI